jgi:hypothetical protein
LSKKIPYHESSVTRSISLDLAATDRSDLELQLLTSTEEGRERVEDDSTSVELELDASGLILTTDLPRRSPYVLGLKRAWKIINIFSVPAPRKGDIYRESK